MRGSIRRRELTSGEARYDVIFRVGGRQKWRTFRKKKRAEAYLNEQMKQVQDGGYREVEPELMKKVFKRWVKVRIETEDELKPSTCNSYRSAVRKHFIPAFGEIRSDQLTPAVVETWRLKMVKKVSDGKLAKKTFNNLHALLKVILAWAREPAQSYMKHDPMDGIRRMKIERAERQANSADFLEAEEITALLGAANDTAEAAVVHLGLFCGLRRGEIFALAWDCIDFEAGQIDVSRAISAGKIGGPKTSYSLRKVDAPADVLDALRRHRSACGSPSEGFVFQSDAGTPVDPDNWSSRVWPPLRKRAGLRDSIGLHSLRHTFASLLIDQGENPKYVSRQLGHASTAFTMDVYGHCFKQTSERAMGRLQETIRAAKRRQFGVVEGGSI